MTKSETIYARGYALMTYSVEPDQRQHWQFWGESIETPLIEAEVMDDLRVAPIKTVRAAAL